MDLTAYFKHFMNTYQGLDDYLVEIDGKTMHEWNYEDGCLFTGAAAMYVQTGDPEYLDYIKPVSYTHLDVYKRQDQVRMTASQRSSSPPM